LILVSSKAAFVAATAFWWSASFYIKAASTAALIDASLSFSNYSSKAFFSASDFAKSAFFCSSSAAFLSASAAAYLAAAAAASAAALAISA